jgi:ADP-ribose pyrophosphatase YjhB (NUDIX family)
MTADFKIQAVPGDEHERSVCQKCDFVRYDNPKVIVGAVTTYKGQYLMCTRGIKPRIGKWTIPIGFMELGETASEGAVRETFEEANATINIKGLICVFNIKRVGQVHMIYSAEMETGEHSPGIESLETRLFNYDDIPFDDLAFPNIKKALTQHRNMDQIAWSKTLLIEDLE